MSLLNNEYHAHKSQLYDLFDSIQFIKIVLIRWALKFCMFGGIIMIDSFNCIVTMI